MNIYLISQDFNKHGDSFARAVVCAKTEEDARNMSPMERVSLEEFRGSLMWADAIHGAESIKVELIGKGDFKAGEVLGHKRNSHLYK